MYSDRCLVVAILNMSWVPTKQCSDLWTYFIPELAPLDLLEQELLMRQPVLQFSKPMSKSSRTKPVWVQSGLGKVRLSPEAVRKTWGVASSLLQTSPDVITPKIPEEDAGATAGEEQARHSKVRWWWEGTDHALEGHTSRSLTHAPLGGHRDTCCGKHKSHPQPPRFYMSVRLLAQWPLLPGTPSPDPVSSEAGLAEPVKAQGYVPRPSCRSDSSFIPPWCFHLSLSPGFPFHSFVSSPFSCSSLSLPLRPCFLFSTPLFHPLHRHRN